MKCLSCFLLFTLIVLLAACALPGSSQRNASDPPATNELPVPPRFAGTWTALLTNTITQQQTSFNFTITQNGSALTGSGFFFPVSSPCFGLATSMTGTVFAASGSTQAGVKLDMWSQSDHTGNHMFLALSPNSSTSAVGTYTLTPAGQSCSAENGTVAVTRQ